MTGLNHAVTGAVLAVAIHNPVIAAPAAFLSHFATDMIPHWHYRYKSSSPLGLSMRITDFLASLLMLGFFANKYSSFLIFICGLLAISPDFMWWNFFLHGKPDPRDGKNLLHILRRMHIKIQWSESGWGIIVELIWFILMLKMLVHIA